MSIEFKYPQICIDFALDELPEFKVFDSIEDLSYVIGAWIVDLVATRKEIPESHMEVQSMLAYLGAMTEALEEADTDNNYSDLVELAKGHSGL